MKFNMEFFNNKRLLVILSGVASIMIAFVIFVMSMIGFGNISAFMFGAKDTPDFTEPPTAGSSITPAAETPSNLPTSTEITDTHTITATPTQSVTETPTADTIKPSDSIPPTETLTTSPETSAPTTPSDIKVTGIKISPAGSISLNSGDEYQLSANVTPANAINYRIEWSSGNESVAFISSTGKVKAVSTAKASAWITVRCYSTITNEQLAVNQIQINVEPKIIAVSKVTILNNIATNEPVKLNIGKTLQIEYLIAPDNASNKTLTWSSSNTAVATVSNTGKITAKAPGKTTIVATAAGGAKASLDIEVVENDTVPTSGTPSSPTSSPSAEPVNP